MHYLLSRVNSLARADDALVFLQIYLIRKPHIACGLCFMFRLIRNILVQENEAMNRLTILHGSVWLIVGGLI
jgi:hypothetical protein